nr:ral GTPase-activating protein subunit alpha-2-like [Mirounga angustirostris]
MEKNTCPPKTYILINFGECKELNMQTCILPPPLIDFYLLKTSSEGSRHKRSSSWGRTYSFTSAVSRGCVTEEENKNVKAGVQAMLQVFLTNAANVFLLEPCPEVPMLLKEQVDACKAVLIIFRRMIMELTMNKKTWEQMLQILLRITEAVMQKPKDKQIKDLFAQSLAGLLFRVSLFY